MTHEYLVDPGVKLIGIDLCDLDRPLTSCSRRRLRGSKGAFGSPTSWARKRSTAQIEKLANLDKLPRPYGFTVMAFPFKSRAPAPAGPGSSRCSRKTSADRQRRKGIAAHGRAPGRDCPGAPRGHPGRRPWPRKPDSPLQLEVPSMSKSTRREFLTKAGIGAGVLFLPGISLTVRASSAPIRIGGSLPLTGAYADTGLWVERGYRYWAEQVNASDGLLGRPVELIIYDDEPGGPGHQPPGAGHHRGPGGPVVGRLSRHHRGSPDGGGRAIPQSVRLHGRAHGLFPAGLPLLFRCAAPYGRVVVRRSVSMAGEHGPRGAAQAGCSHHRQQRGGHGRAGRLGRRPGPVQHRTGHGRAVRLAVGLGGTPGAAGQGPGRGHVHRQRLFWRRRADDPGHAGPGLPIPS